MGKIRVAINGFGRIGRVYLRNAIQNPEIEIVAINDVANTETLAHLLRYDSVHRAFPGEVKVSGDRLLVNGKSIRVVSAKDPGQLPWRENKVDVVVESTGLFLDLQSAKK